MSKLEATVLALNPSGGFELLVEGTEEPDWFSTEMEPASDPDKPAPKRARKPRSPKTAEVVENAVTEGSEPEPAAPESVSE